MIRELAAGRPLGYRQIELLTGISHVHVRRIVLGIDQGKAKQTAPSRVSVGHHSDESH